MRPPRRSSVLLMQNSICICSDISFSVIFHVDTIVNIYAIAIIVVRIAEMPSVTSGPCKCDATCRRYIPHLITIKEREPLTAEGEYRFQY